MTDSTTRNHMRQRMVQVCRCCKGELLRSARTSFFDYTLSCLGFYPFACKRCRQRSWRAKLEQAVVVFCVLAVGLSATGAVAYKVKRAKRGPIASEVTMQPVHLGDASRKMTRPAGERVVQADMELQDVAESAPGVLRNNDVVDLSKAGAGPEVINKLIGKIAHDFRIDPKSVLHMKRAGVVDKVISEIIDVTTVDGVTQIPPARGTPPAHGARPEPRPLWVKRNGSDTAVSFTSGGVADPRMALGLVSVR